MRTNRHGKFRAKSPDPPSTPLPSDTLFTSERSNMDYFTLAGVCKRTGATEDELAVFGVKENTDNALDFSEVNLPSSYNGNPEIFVDVKYNPEQDYLVIKVRNSNFGLKDIGFTEERIHAIFDDLDRSHSSKRNLSKISRGLQGDALKEEVFVMDGDGFGYFQIRLEKGYLEFRQLKKLEEILVIKIPYATERGRLSIICDYS